MLNTNSTSNPKLAVARMDQSGESAETPALRQALREGIRDSHRIDEGTALARLIPLAQLEPAAQVKVKQQALGLATAVRKAAQQHAGLQKLLNEYALSTQEGVVLMCLAEALLRVPDSTTADNLIRDKLMMGDWAAHLQQRGSLFVNAASWGLLVSGNLVGFNDNERQLQIDNVRKLTGRLSEPVIRAAMRQAMRIMGGQFVLGRTIDEARRRGQQARSEGYRYSYDMLGEAARTMKCADTYYAAYKNAIDSIGQRSSGLGSLEADGISVKLSALHPRYEFSQRERVMQELAPRLLTLAQLAKGYDIGLTVDAEEADRLELSLDIIETVFTDPSLDGWQGFGMAVQAYQKRSLDVIRWAIALARRCGRKMPLRLVKGAYWDSEIKHVQVEGLSDYPVYTRKAGTDVAYQACAAQLLQNRDVIYPQFATHNAYTVAYILELAGDSDLNGFEFQRLHGMGEELYQSLLADSQLPCRIYAPVGQHENLLAYLVRRLLENGANSSFVNNIVDKGVSLEQLTADPLAKLQGYTQARNPHIPLPANLFGNKRKNSMGTDLNTLHQEQHIQSYLREWGERHVSPYPVSPYRESTALTGSKPQLSYARNPSNTAQCLGQAPVTASRQFSEVLQCSSQVQHRWGETPVHERAACLLRLAQQLEQRADEFIALCIKEAGKTAFDAVAELREAVDFCRYYAGCAIDVLEPKSAEDSAVINSDEQLVPRGVVVCISPWNFPLAIFLGQVTAALAAGNSVIAKPSEQTVLIAKAAVALLPDCGFPNDLVQVINARGKVVGEQLLDDARVSAVMFTGSTTTGAWIATRLAQRPGPRVPLIAETGGQNCMVVDSTALPEQVVDDVIASGFQSAGQRCSALRVLYLQEEVADTIIAMIIGAMQELQVGDSAKPHTDVGPVIDERALETLNGHMQYMTDRGRLLYQCELSDECSEGYFFAPCLYEIDNISVLREEVFGPVIHVIRYRAKDLSRVYQEINSTGFGLTFGVHSRIQHVAEDAARAVRAGNVYVNRNTIGAVVGVQPFGGQGLSGTGPKAGGPFYLLRLLTRNETSQQADDAASLALQGESPNSAQQSSAGSWAPGLAKQFNSWRDQSSRQRIEVLQNLVAEAANQCDVSRYAALLAQAERMLVSPKTLPGPTGESNQLFIEPRGLIVCISDIDNNDTHANDTSAKDATNPSDCQLLAALATGNAVIHAVLPEFCETPLQASLNQSRQVLGTAASDKEFDLPYQCVELKNQAALAELLNADEIAGVAVSGSTEFAALIEQLLRQQISGGSL